MKAVFEWSHTVEPNPIHYARCDGLYFHVRREGRRATSRYYWAVLLDDGSASSTIIASGETVTLPTAKNCAAAWVDGLTPEGLMLLTRKEDPCPV